jgi:hypothetical protein
MSCKICIEVFNKTSNKVIKCYCGFECCKSCAQTYILSKNEKAHCMNCKVEWNHEFMYKNFDRLFIKNEYRHFRENILYEKELSLMPETQAFIKQEIEKTHKINDIYSQMKILRNEMITLQTTLNNIRNNEYNTQKSKFIKKCPNNTCNGFLSTDFICSLCNTEVCETCREIKHKNTLIPGVTDPNRGRDHVCDENILKTVHLLKNDCKECPSCSVTIFKIDGCDQMFCTSCHTAFDWKTSKIQTGNIHNPHYFEWLKQNNGDSGTPDPRQDTYPYTRELNDQFIINLIRKLRNTCTSVYEISFFVDEIQKAMHIKNVELQNFTINIVNNNRDLRVQFLKNEITKDEFKKSIRKREKKDEKNKEVYNVLNMYITCVTDIIYNIKENIKKSNFDMNMFKYEIKCLKEYTNNHLKKISTVYNCKVFVIT